MNKKLLIVCPYYPPHLGGLERYAHSIATKMSLDSEWSVSVLTTGDRYSFDIDEIQDDIKIYRLGYRTKLYNTPFSFQWLHKAKKIIAIEKPDLINIHTPVPGLGDVVSFIAPKSIPTIITYHSGTMKKGNFVADFIIKIYESYVLRLMLNRAIKIVCSSEYVRSIFLQKYLYKSETITPGVDHYLFSRDKKSYTPGTRMLFVAALGRSEQYKGLQVLLDIMPKIIASVPDATLSIVGEGDMRSVYESQVKECGLENHIQFQGALSGERLVTEFTNSNIFVHPSFKDSSPTVIIEAMSMSLPVISTTTGGIPDIVEEGQTGVLVDAGDKEALASALICMLVDTKRQIHFGSNGRQVVEKKYTWDVRMLQLKKLADDIVRDVGFHKIKILVVSPYLFPKIGGVEKYAYEIGRELQKTGKYEVCFITSSLGKKTYTQEIREGMRIHKIPIRWKLSNSPVDYRAYGWIKKIINSERPDIVHAHAPVPFFAEIAALATPKGKYVLSYHSGTMLKGTWFIDAIILIHEKLVLPLLFSYASLLTTVSSVVRDDTLKKWSEKVSIIPPGVSDFNDDYQIIALTSHPAVVTFIGRIELSSKWKGLDILINAFSEICKVHKSVILEIVGEGDALSFYKREVKRLKISERVVFTGAQSGDDLKNAYQRSSVVVLPSTTNAESFGMVLLEAMSFSRAVVGSRIGGIPTLIEHNTDGLLVEPGDVQDLTKAILSILNDSNLRIRLAKNGFIKAQEYTWSSQAEKFSTLFQKLHYEN